MTDWLAISCKQKLQQSFDRFAQFLFDSDGKLLLLLLLARDPLSGPIILSHAFRVNSILLFFIILEDSILHFGQRVRVELGLARWVAMLIERFRVCFWGRGGRATIKQRKGVNVQVGVRPRAGVELAWLGWPIYVFSSSIDCLPTTSRTDSSWLAVQTIWSSSRGCGLACVVAAVLEAIFSIVFEQEDHLVNWNFDDSSSLNFAMIDSLPFNRVLRILL